MNDAVAVAGLRAGEVESAMVAASSIFMVGRERAGISGEVARAAYRPVEL